MKTSYSQYLSLNLAAPVHLKEMYKDVAEEVKVAALRRQAIQILGLPEEFCLEEENLGCFLWVICLTKSVI